MRILHITSSLDGGGIASLLMDYCSRLIPDLEFDFVITSKQEGFLEQPLRNLGCNIYRVEQFRISPIKYFSQLKKIIKSGGYDIVHDHADYRSFFGLMCAKMCGVKKRIAHSHLAYVKLSKKARVEKAVFTPLVKSVATGLVACSSDAAKWTWGKTNNNVFIMKNAIETDRFAFSESKRTSIRQQYELNNKFVIGNVARFTYQKNHKFLIDILKEMLKIKKNTVLLLVGDGDLFNEVKEYTINSGLQKYVLFLGTRNDVPDLLNAMDCFVLPTRFEGLGIAYIEAQANGLYSFGTKSVVPEEANIDGGLIFIDEKESAQVWAQRILDINDSRIRNANKKVVAAGYDIDEAVEKLRRYYFSL